MNTSGDRVSSELVILYSQELITILSCNLYFQVFIHNFVHGDLHPGNILVQDGRGGRGYPKLVLLDCGIATSLGRQDLENIKAVFTAIVKGEVDPDSHRDSVYHCINHTLNKMLIPL